MKKSSKIGEWHKDAHQRHSFLEARKRTVSQPHFFLGNIIFASFVLASHLLAFYCFCFFSLYNFPSFHFSFLLFVTRTSFSYDMVLQFFLVSKFLVCVKFPVMLFFYGCPAKVPWRFSLCQDPWCYWTNSFNKAWTHALCKFKSCLRHVEDLRWWESVTVVLAGNKA